MYLLQTLEEENFDTLTWTEWTPNMLKSKKSKELQITNSNINEDESFSLRDEKRVLAQSNLKYKTLKQLKVKKSKELQISNNNTNEDESVSLDNDETVEETVLASSYKENCNPAVTNSSQRPNLKHKKSKQLKVNATKRNERYYDLAQSKLELVEILKENNDKKSTLEISILEMQLEKEKLHVEILKKQLLMKRNRKLLHSSIISILLNSIISYLDYSE